MASLLWLIAACMDLVEGWGGALALMISCFFSRCILSLPLLSHSSKLSLCKTLWRWWQGQSEWTHRLHLLVRQKSFSQFGESLRSHENVVFLTGALCSVCNKLMACNIHRWNLLNQIFNQIRYSVPLSKDCVSHQHALGDFVTLN